MVTVTSNEDKKAAELVESIAVALLSVRNARGKIIPVPDPLRYARYIAEDLQSAKLSKTVEAGAQA